MTWAEISDDRTAVLNKVLGTIKTTIKNDREAVYIIVSLGRPNNVLMCPVWTLETWNEDFPEREMSKEQWGDFQEWLNGTALSTWVGDGLAECFDNFHSEQDEDDGDALQEPDTIDPERLRLYCGFRLDNAPAHVKDLPEYAIAYAALTDALRTKSIEDTQKVLNLVRALVA